MRDLKFIKMRGLENDFVLIDNRSANFVLNTNQLKTIANRRTGVGCDQILVLNSASNMADVKLNIFNSDGSEAEACGNGTRCVAFYLMKQLKCDAIDVETKAGILSASWDSEGLIKVNMGTPKLDWASIPLAKEYKPLLIPTFPESLGNPVFVNIGNPHTVFFVKNLDGIDPRVIGSQIETHPLFPEKTNVEFVLIKGENKLRLRVWERGVGLTPACGSGACAAVVAAHLKGFVKSEVNVELDSGELKIIWPGMGDVFMVGPATISYSGIIEPAILLS